MLKLGGVVSIAMPFTIIHVALIITLIAEYVSVNVSLVSTVIEHVRINTIINMVFDQHLCVFWNL